MFYQLQNDQVNTQKQYQLTLVSQTESIYLGGEQKDPLDKSG